MSKSLKPVAPAGNKRGKFSFPVLSASGKEIALGGAIQATITGSTVLLVDPKISIGGVRAGNFIISGPGSTPGQVETIALIHIASFTKVAVNAKTREWTGILQAPVKDTPTAPATAVAQLLSQLCGAEISPGTTLGSIKVTVKTS